MFCHSKNFRKPQIWDKRNSTILWPHRLTGNPTSPTFTFSFKPHLDLTALLKQQGVLAALGKHPRNLPWVIFLFAKSSNSKRLSCSASIQVQNFAVKEKINSEFNSTWFLITTPGINFPFFWICTPKPELCTSGWSATAGISLATSRWPWRSTKRCSASCLFSCSWWWFKVSTEQKPVTFHAILVV